LAAVNDVIDSGCYLLGDRVRGLEVAVERDWGTPALATSSGSSALQIALLAAGVGPGDEVLVPALTFVSTAFAVCAVGATPVFVDIDPTTYTLDPGAGARAVSSRTAALIAVHLYGQMAPMPALLDLAAAHQLVVIEDCAQAHGAELAGAPAGSWGMFGCFSLYVGKNIGGLEDAGLITFGDPGQRAELVRLRDLGRDPGLRYRHESWGLRARLGEFSAAVVGCQLPLLAAWNQRRQQIAARYDRALASVAVATVPTVAPGRTHVYYKYTVLAADPTGLAAHLATCGVETERIYPRLVCDQPAFTHLPHRVESLPVARAVVNRLVCLPMFPELRDDEVDRVIDAVTDWAALDLATRGVQPAGGR